MHSSKENLRALLDSVSIVFFVPSVNADEGLARVGKPGNCVKLFLVPFR